MRLSHFRRHEGEEPWAGVVLDDDTVVNVETASEAAGFALPSTTVAILEEWEWHRKLELLAQYAAETGTGVVDKADLETFAPIRDPGKVIAVGLNYRDHAAEGGHDVPDTPVLFAKFPSSIVGGAEPIEWDPSVAEQVDYEAELVIVIGKEARDVDPDDAWDAIAGYTVGNDVSARDIQHGDGQWVRGKSLDTFGPTGPELVTSDAVADPHDLAIWTEVNGERLQESSTSQLIFGVNELVSFCSQTSTLFPGDLVFTGTPPGVGIYREPRVLLDDGDTVSVGIDGLGVLTNECRHR